MRIRLSDLWRLDGTIDRLPYLFWGVTLAIHKLIIDRFVIGSLTSGRWDYLVYWVPGDVFGTLDGLANQPGVFVPVALTALPFTYAGTALTIRRLRAARWPLPMVLLFFIPLLNLFFFAILTAVPTKRDWLEELPPEARALARFIPRRSVSGAAFAVALSVGLVVPIVVASTELLGQYGWGVFLGAPFVIGFSCALIYGFHDPRSLGGVLGVALLALFTAGLVLFFTAIEGLICIVMAAPIALLFAFLGALFGYAIQRMRDHGASLPAILPILPLLIAAEGVSHREPPVIEVTTAMEINAPPNLVWRHVVSFAEIPPPKQWFFRAGIAHPLRAEINGTGAGAVRRCVFSTGAFVEPIEVWDEPRLLKFSVTQCPPPMEEWSLWPGIRPPHLDGYFASRGGQFKLHPLPGGRTRLEGTTWYVHDLWPTWYWKPWSDQIIHAIHRRVLVHIRAQAEAR